VIRIKKRTAFFLGKIKKPDVNPAPMAKNKLQTITGFLVPDSSYRTVDTCLGIRPSLGVIRFKVQYLGSGYIAFLNLDSLIGHNGSPG
jgi:hypothetical protein